MLLTLDRGNSTLDLMLHAAAAVRVRVGVAPAAGGAGARADSARDTLRDVLRDLLRNVPPDMLRDEAGDRAAAAPAGAAVRAVGVSVVPGGLDDAEAALRAFGVGLRVYGRELPCPLPLRYDTPETLGGDRVLGAFAAHRRFGRAVVVDCGSATTVNLVEADGTFCGGAIAPGLRALAAGMATRTPHLPRDLDAPFAIPPRSSAGAVAAGVRLAFCGGIERLVADTLRSARGPATVVLTGGHAEDYLRHGRLQPVLRPDLVHEGLRLLAGGEPGAGAGAGAACGS